MRRSGRFTPARSSRRAVMTALIAVAALALLIGIYAVGRWIENRGYHEERQQMTEGFGQLHTVTYDGKTYVKRTDVDTVLLMGVDREEKQEEFGYRGGGQADFLLLLAVDHKNGSIHQLQIDRNTITDVPVVGVLGNDAGTRQMQICLAHAYGGDEKARCQHTMQAVANLLGGEMPQQCISVWMSAIGELNSRLGGLTVTVPDDYSHLDPALKEGAVVTLNDRQAELLVRSRMGMQDSSNAARMRRQRAFMTAVIEKLRANMRADAQYAETVFEIIDAVSGYSSAGRAQIVNEIGRAYNYDIPPVETLAGEYKIGSDGYEEFHAADASVVGWVLQTLYEPK